MLIRVVLTYILRTFLLIRLVIQSHWSVFSSGYFSLSNLVLLVCLLIIFLLSPRHLCEKLESYPDSWCVTITSLRFLFASRKLVANINHFNPVSNEIWFAIGLYFLRRPLYFRFTHTARIHHGFSFKNLRMFSANFMYLYNAFWSYPFTTTSLKCSHCPLLNFPFNIISFS